MPAGSRQGNVPCGEGLGASLRGSLSPGLRFKRPVGGSQHRCYEGPGKHWWVTSTQRGVSQEFSDAQGSAYKGDSLAWWTLETRRLGFKS